MDRRRFNLGLAGAVAAAGLPARARAARYRGPNVILIRFGGGVRRRETVEAATSYAPALVHDLIPRGTFIPDMRIDALDGVETSHAEGTLNLLTGRYLAYRDAGSRGLSTRLEPTEPTLFEYLRRSFDIPSHQVLLINGEDRPQEEFFTYGVHRHYGISYRSEMLSLHRFKLYRNAHILAEATADDATLERVREEYDALLAADPRTIAPEQSPEVTGFWARWRARFGDDGLRNPRGDRLLTELALRAMAELRPRMMMVNYQDPDYVHWGNASHYTRAISVIDDGIARIVAAVDADPAYRDNTVICITPDCGRDANPLLGVPFQHHFNTDAARETWALFVGSGIAAGQEIDGRFDQIDVAPTLAAAMGLPAPQAEGRVLDIGT